MGNREGSLNSRHSTISDISSSETSRPSGCPYRPNSASRSSTDSEPSSCPLSASLNNNDSALLGSIGGTSPAPHKISQGGCPDMEVLHAAAHKTGPMKQRKVSRAASAGRIRSRRSFRNIPGMGSFSAKSDVMGDGLKDAVQDTWQAVHAVVPSTTEIGVGIYQRIFVAAPELRGVFRIPEDMPIEDLPGFTQFHRSAKLFVSVIELCVRNIHSLEAEMGPVLVMYGRRHYHYLFEFQYRQCDGGFRGIHLPLFAQCILEYVFANIPDEERTDEAQIGWHSLLGYITNKVAEGYELERHRNASLRRKSIL